MSKPLVLVVGILGIVFLAAAVMYFMMPAGSLPGFFPGHETGLMKHHYKHAVGALLLGLACLAYTWFQSGKKSMH